MRKKPRRFEFPCLVDGVPCSLALKEITPSKYYRLSREGLGFNVFEIRTVKYNIKTGNGPMAKNCFVHD